jgi:hypothetical protein
VARRFALTAALALGLAGASIAACGARTPLLLGGTSADGGLVDGGALADAPAPGDAPVVPDAPHPSGCPAGTQSVLAQNEEFPTGIAVDATNVYWATGGDACSGGRIRAMPKGGGAIKTLADGQSNPRALIADAANVYWYDGCDTAALRSVPLAGGSVRDYAIQVSPTEDARALAGNGTNLYFNSYGILGIPKSGGVQFVIDDSDYVYGIAADDGGVYWLGPIGTGTTQMAVFGLATGGGKPTMLVQESVGTGIAIDATWVYFTGVGIQRVPRGGGAIGTVVPAGNVGYDITTDGTSVYWLEGNAAVSQYGVRRTPVGGGADTVLAHGQGWAYHIALDDDCVYWTNPGANAVETAPK